MSRNRSGLFASLLLTVLPITAACAPPRGAAARATRPAEKVRGRAPAEDPVTPVLPAAFLERIGARGVRIDAADPLARRIVADYGAQFLTLSCVPPPTWMFDGEASVADFQEDIESGEAHLGSVAIRLQAQALDALGRARVEVLAQGGTLTPPAPEAARRTYADTERLWESRVEPALVYWVSRARLTQADADRVRHLSGRAQVDEVLRLEGQGIFFSQSLDKSILYSVAAPGTSQHLSMLAMDIREHADSGVRRALAEQGWFQTVYSDKPHFTYLGVAEAELPALGLVKRVQGDRHYWVVRTEALRGQRDEPREPVEVCAF